MNQLPIEKNIIVKRLDGIEAELVELRILADQQKEEFVAGPGYKLAQYHLHRALEGVFNIGSHILSRIPGTTATRYREIAEQLSQNGIVPEKFAFEKLVPMAKCRNRLVHFYAEITSDELYNILQNHLGDFEVFLSAIKKLIENPEQYNVRVE